jgi:hypothetical protein
MDAAKARRAIAASNRVGDFGACGETATKVRVNKYVLTRAVFAALFAITPTAAAVLHCVDTVSELRSAVSAVTGAAGASNEIRIAVGTYDVASGASGAYSLSLTLSSAPLQITGGWNTGCTARNFIADATILNGSDAVRIMSLTALAGQSANLLIDGISFRNGLSSSGSNASCLLVQTDVGAEADIRLDRNTFRGCMRSGTGTGPALEVIARNSTVAIRSNVFTDNLGNVGTVMLRNLGGGNIRFNGNTVAYNHSLPSGGPAGVQTSSTGSGTLWLIGNILFANGVSGASDLFVGLDNVVFSNSNVFGQLAGDLGDLVQTENLSADPRFQSPTDLRLRANSIARNSGNNAGLGGFADRDAFGDPRQQGSRIDRGALEFSELFANGFE